MKKNLLILSVLVLSLSVALVAFAALKGNKIELKVGDEVYACACGAGCNCDTLSRQAGKCSCGSDLVKAKVTKVDCRNGLRESRWLARSEGFQDRREICLRVRGGLQLRHDKPEARQVRMRIRPEGVWQTVTIRF